MIWDNYRPISLLPVFSKIFERVIFDQLHNHFNLHNLYFESQYGFRKKHSTESAVLELVDKTIKHRDSGDVPISIFLDLSKAFNTLDHDILLDKLSYYGVKETALSLFKSYLSKPQAICGIFKYNIEFCRHKNRSATRLNFRSITFHHLYK